MIFRWSGIQRESLGREFLSYSIIYFLNLKFIDIVFFVIKGFRTIAFIFIVISTTFRRICNSGLLQVFVKLRNLYGTSKYPVQQTPEEGQRTYRPKRCGNNNKDVDNSPKTLNDKYQQASCQEFWQLIIEIVFGIFVKILLVGESLWLSGYSAWLRHRSKRVRAPAVLLLSLLN